MGMGVSMSEGHHLRLELADCNAACPFNPFKRTAQEEVDLAQAVAESDWGNNGALIPALFPHGHSSTAEELACKMNKIGAEYRPKEVEVEMSYAASPKTVIAVWDRLGQKNWGKSQHVAVPNNDGYYLYDLSDLEIGQTGKILTSYGSWVFVQRITEDEFYHVRTEPDPDYWF
jgi:hypothetical protein